LHNHYEEKCDLLTFNLDGVGGVSTVAQCGRIYKSILVSINYFTEGFEMGNRVRVPSLKGVIISIFSVYRHQPQVLPHEQSVTGVISVLSIDKH